MLEILVIAANAVSEINGNKQSKTSKMKTRNIILSGVNVFEFSL